MLCVGVCYCGVDSVVVLGLLCCAVWMVCWLGGVLVCFRCGVMVCVLALRCRVLLCYVLVHSLGACGL